MGPLTLILTSSLVGLGALLYLIAEKLPPNPFVGFRVGYSYVSKDVWVKVTKVSALALVALGGAGGVVGYLWGDLSAAVCTMLGVLVIVIALIPYAERLAEKELIKKPSEKTGTHAGIPRVPPNLALTLLTLASSVGSIAYLLLNYPHMPDRIATHFGLTLNPDSFGPKSEAVIANASGVSIITLVTLLIYYLGWKKPEALYKPWFDLITFRKIVNALYILLASVTMMASLGVVAVVQYSLTQAPDLLLKYSFYGLLALSLGMTLYILNLNIKAYGRKKISFHND
jgi:hypothetical protein